MSNEKTTDTTNPDILDDIAKAKLARERKRQQAPEMAIGEIVEIPQKKLFRQFCPEAVRSKDNPEPKWHVMFGDKTLYRQYVESDGYEPVLHKGQPVKFGADGDIMLKIPMDLYERGIAIAKARSDRMVEAKMRHETVETRNNPAAHDEKTEILKPGTKRYAEVEAGRE